jgi:hypothetical protein
MAASAPGRRPAGVPRYSLVKDLDDLVFRALLGQQLIIYCHQAGRGVVTVVPT